VPTPRPRTKLKTNRNHRKSLQACITILHVIYDIIMLQLLLKQQNTNTFLFDRKHFPKSRLFANINVFKLFDLPKSRLNYST